MSDVVDTWFALCRQMPECDDASALRLPSLRDACYVSVISRQMFKPDADQKIVETFINGLEEGALNALRAAWDSRPMKNR